MEGSDGPRVAEPRASSSRGSGVRGLLAFLTLVWVAGLPNANASDRTRLAEPPIPIPEFSLIDQDGRAFTAVDLRGRVALVFFGFTHCENVCPATLQVLRQAERALTPPGSSLRTLLISVDGERDTPAVMKAYLEPYGPGFIGLTGTPSEVGELARGFQAVFFKGMPRPAGGYDVEHTSQVYLVDREGHLRATFFGAGSEEIAAATRVVLQESP